jgi:hypothetical protein
VFLNELMFMLVLLSPLFFFFLGLHVLGIVLFNELLIVDLLVLIDLYLLHFFDSSSS